jgi:hypothetical protein
MKWVVGALVTLSAALPLHAETASPPQRVSTLVVYGNDACPRSADPNEITVCARQPESERFRIPKRLRGKRAKAGDGGQSWASTVRDLEYVGREGRPNSCSVVGSGGFTGCYQQFLQQARDERRLAEQEAAGTP